MESARNLLIDGLIVFGIAGGVFLAGKLLVRLGCQHLEKFGKKNTLLAATLLRALQQTKPALLAIFAIWMGLEWLELGKAESWLDRIGFFVVVVQAGIWASAFLGGFVLHYGEKRAASEGRRSAGILWFSYLIQVVIWSTAFLLIISNLGYDVTALIAGLGIGGIAIGLALQNILGDLFASLSIVLDKPFEVGDFIIVGDLLGTVEKVGIKTTRVRSLSGEQLVFPNNDLTSSRIRNFKRMYERRVVFGFGVLYQTTPDQLEEIPKLIKSFIEARPETRFDRAHFKGFGESSYDFEVVYYVLGPDYTLYMDLQQSINLALVRAFAERGIEFAYPTRTLYVSRDESAKTESTKDAI